MTNPNKNKLSVFLAFCLAFFLAEALFLWLTIRFGNAEVWGPLLKTALAGACLYGYYRGYKIPGILLLAYSFLFAVVCFLAGLEHDSLLSYVLSFFYVSFGVVMWSQRKEYYYQNNG